VLLVKAFPHRYSTMKDECRFRPAVFKLRGISCSSLICAAAISLQANTITVTNTNDSGPGSLRQTLADANDGDTISFAVTGTISLTSGELLVDKSLTISGPAGASLAVDGDSNSRVFHIGSGRTVTISGLTIANGNAIGSYPDRKGGGIYNDHAALTLNNCLVTNNTGMDGGGGVSNDNGTLTMIDCTISLDSTGDRGGGILNEGGTLTINNCVVGPNQWATRHQQHDQQQLS
jgi:hypothetical protein